MNTPARDQRQAEHVALALIEHGQPRQRARQQRAQARDAAPPAPATCSEPRAGASTRAGARLRVLAIARNFDAGGREPPRGLTIALHDRR